MTFHHDFDLYFMFLGLFLLMFFQQNYVSFPFNAPSNKFDTQCTMLIKNIFSTIIKIIIIIFLRTCKQHNIFCSLKLHFTNDIIRIHFFFVDINERKKIKKAQGKLESFYIQFYFIIVSANTFPILIHW